MLSRRGVVPTPLYGELNEDDLKSLHHMQPLGRYGTPQDVADAVMYLTHASWVTGTILPVDGGSRRRRRRNVPRDDRGTRDLDVLKGP